MKGRKFDVFHGGKTDGGGPEDPMLDARVGRLEEKVDRIEALLLRLEPKITEALLTGAKQTDLGKLQLQMTELQGGVAKQVDLQKVQTELAEVKGKISGVEARFSSLPTTWTMLGIVFTTWALGSGILIFAMNYLKK